MSQACDLHFEYYEGCFAKNPVNSGIICPMGEDQSLMSLIRAELSRPTTLMVLSEKSPQGLLKKPLTLPTTQKNTTH